ncbi:MAG: hypothetical protein K2X87_12850 [Gemmataceae bacterium]|nr:hypothetical protein [Gemmataceae bacterium]
MPQPVDLSPLAAAACPLLVKYGGPAAGPLIDRFNAAVAEVAALRADRQLAPLLLSGRLDDTLRPLVKVRSLLTQSRAVVGCIGLTQAGKSTTVNNVLGEEVCKPGSGDATSSQPGRILRADRRSLDIEYLTPDRFAARRQKLCEELRLATPPDDRELLELLGQPDKFRTADGPEPPRLKEDLAYLRDFLGAYARHRNFVTSPPRIDAGLPYDRRYAYTTHTPGGPGAEVLLVREARLHVPNDRLPADLELCDLPGLDSKRSVDDIVTWEYLPDLHGTFLFVNVGANLLSQGTLAAIGRVRQQFGDRLAGRAWLILNKMDTLTADHFRPGGQDNVFATIARLLEKTGVPESQVVFSSKKVWDAVDAAAGRADPAFAARTMGQPAESPVPPTCPPGLRAAWMELLKDGGVGLLRRLMFQEVAETLAGQIRQDVDRLLTDFGTAFAGRVAAERKRLAMGGSELQAAVTCYNVVLQLRAVLATRPAEFAILTQEAERLRHELTGLFDRTSPRELLVNLGPEELSRQFRTLARVLGENLDAELSGDVLDRVYESVGQRLDGLPAVGIGSEGRECKDAWRQFALEDRADDRWRAGLPRFASDDLAGWLAQPNGDGPDGDVYAGLMRDKIAVAVRQTAHLVRSRLRHRLGQIAGDLALLTGTKDETT